MKSGYYEGTLRGRTAAMREHCVLKFKIDSVRVAIAPWRRDYRRLCRDRFPAHSRTSEDSSWLFPVILQDAVKLLHQVGEPFWVFFLNDGLREVLPCFAGVTNHSGCFFQDIRVSDISSPLRPSAHD
jgi:hypothetical protein